MTKKIGDKKLSSITSATETRGVKQTDSISHVDSVKATDGVGSVRGAGAVSKRRATRVMSIEEREALLEIIGEEAEKMASEGTIPQNKKEIIATAVKMAVDAGILSAEELAKAKK